MKKTTLYIVSGLLLIIFATIGLEAYFVRNNHDIKTFKKQLRQKEDEADKIFFREKEYIEKDNYQTLKDNQEVISYYVYKKDSLVYWSNFKSKVPSKYSKSFFNKTFLQLNNGYYNVRDYHLDDKNIIALIHIYEKHPFQNPYLENRFTKDFSQIHKNRVSKSETTGEAIYTKDGKFLLSLSKGKRLQKDSTPLILIFSLYFILFGLLLFFFMRKLFKSTLKQQLFMIFTAGILLFIIRYIMLEYKEPISLTGLMLFSPQLHASSSIYKSLGDYWLNASFLTTLLYGISLLKINKISWLSNNSIAYLITILLLGSLLIIGDYAFVQIESLVKNSTFPLQIQTPTINITFYTIWAYSGAAIFIFAIILTINIIINFFNKNFNYSSFYLVWTFFSLVLIIICLFFNHKYLDKIIFIAILGFLRALQINGIRQDISYFANIITLILCSVFLTYLINGHSAEKEKQARIVQAKSKMYSEYPLRRIMLETMAPEMEKDQLLNKKLQNPIKNESAIKRYIKTKYFNYKWTNYTVDIFFCHENIEELNAKKTKKCMNVWEQLQNNNQIIGNSFFYKTTTHNNSDSYIGEISFSNRKYHNLKLIITLKRKLYDDGLGYPELLLNSTDKRIDINKYSFAKYFNNKLQYSKGNFNYHNDLKTLERQKKINNFIEFEGYNHYIHNADDDSKIIISQEMTSIYKKYNSLPYIFILFFILFTFVSFVQNKNWNKVQLSFFQQKIKFFFIGIFTIIFTFVGFASLYYTYKTNEQRYSKEHKEKIKRIRKELFGDIKNSFDLKKSVGNKDSFTQKLKQSARLIGADINIYNTTGNLISTSQPEIFKENIISTRMNNKAISALQQRKMTEVTLQEQIGKLEYSSVYVTIWDSNNNVIAYLNIPFFLNYKEFTGEIQTMTITILSISLFIIILVIIIAYLISQNITQSLTSLQERFLNLQLVKKNKLINYEKEDEIAPLIAAYNQMVKKIEKQSKELAINEKEVAWREMARQVAHEIKNPLTPMKLNIQFLQRQLTLKDSNWEKKFHEISNVLLTEIDELADTASTFSDFAKISKTKGSLVDLVEILQELTILYEQGEVKVKLDKKTQRAPIFADKIQIRRVFINLISNATQAISKKEDGEVRITIKEKNGWIKVFVKDNGGGISKNIQDKIFTPNFTTKNSGMGLGLAITKEIIKQSNGTINFRTTENKGTIFIIQFPVYK